MLGGIGRPARGRSGVEHNANGLTCLLVDRVPGVDSLHARYRVYTNRRLPSDS